MLNPERFSSSAIPHLRNSNPKGEFIIIYSMKEKLIMSRRLIFTPDERIDTFKAGKMELLFKSEIANWIDRFHIAQKPAKENLMIYRGIRIYIMNDLIGLSIGNG